MRRLSEIIKARKRFVELGVPVYHSHTNVDDDGVISVQELIEKAVASNVTILYVTGHNRTQGSEKTMEALKGKKTIIEIYPGVEVDAPFGASGIVHFVVIGPNDENAIDKMHHIGEEIYHEMLANYQWRRREMLSWAQPEKFDSVWYQVVESRRAELEKIWNHFLSILNKRGLREGVLSELSCSKDEGPLDMLKRLLQKCFCDVSAFIAVNPIRGEIYNKLDVMGNFTDQLEHWPADKAIWSKGTAGIRRKAMRAFLTLCIRMRRWKKYRMLKWCGRRATCTIQSHWLQGDAGASRIRAICYK
jgi:hypothetical protein